MTAIRTAAEQRILGGYADLLNRRVEVENALFAAAKGDGLNAERCRELAIKLGTPTEFQHSAASAAGQNMLPPTLDVIHAMSGMTYATAMAACDNVRTSGKTSSMTLHHEAGQSDEVTDSVICGYDANGSPVDELSRDLIEAARDARGG